MGTKNNPGKFDCHASAEDDEPLFTLLARDPLAPYLVAAWAEMRMGQGENAREIIADMILAELPRYYTEPDTAKSCEALVCAGGMVRWRQDRYGTTKPDTLQARIVRRLVGDPPPGRCGTPACPQCSDTIALEPGFIHEGP